MGVIDNKSEKYYRHSPYVYIINNPINFIDPDGNEVVPVTRSNFNGPIPSNIHDLGNTRLTSLEFTYNKNSKEYDLNVGIMITYSQEFTPKNFMDQSNVMENDNGNPGLLNEVKNHEEGHRDQIVEGASKDVSFTIGDKTIVGSADEVLTKVVGKFSAQANGKISNLANQLKNGDIDQDAFNSKLGKIRLSTDKAIGNAVNNLLGQVSENIQNTMSSGDIEDDANRRASRVTPLIYANGSRSIMYNDQALQSEQ